MSRRVARDYAYKLIFEYLFSRESESPTLDIFLMDSALTGADKVYVETVVNGVKENYDELFEMITKYTIGFSADRLFKPDVSALLLCAYELKFMPEIPYNASINECIELVKTYSTEKSTGYVNGILASVLKELKEEKND